jgi:divalent metal cation (Fe/Co/Zn/Cd) transporter
VRPVLRLGFGSAVAQQTSEPPSVFRDVGGAAAPDVTFFAVRLGARPADFSHPYGHRRAENLSALTEATILVAGGLFVTIEAIGRLSGGDRWPRSGMCSQ